MIPDEINRNHVLSALDEIKKNGVPEGRESTKFDLLHEGERYPPKYVISMATVYANGKELDSTTFSGGDETNSFLRNLGFEIAAKKGDSYWIFSVNKENWKISRSSRIWAVDKENVTKKIEDRDYFVLYVKDEEAFCSVMRVTGDWYNAKEPIWDNEKADGQVKYLHQVKTELILEGYVKLRNIVERLSFMENKEKAGVYLRGTPANMGRPIPESDYKIMYDALEKNPLPQDLRSGPEVYNVTPVWIEKTIVSGRLDREEGDYALGKALWSPQASVTGADIYKNMRSVRKGDLVLHLIDNKTFVGISKVASEADTNFKCLPGTEWDDVKPSGSRLGFLIRLDGYVRFDNPIPREDILISSNKAKLMEIIEKNSDVFYN